MRGSKWANFADEQFSDIFQINFAEFNFTEISSLKVQILNFLIPESFCPP